jgi:serine/threonine protein kinase/Tfp pilus assembly protein PilF
LAPGDRAGLDSWGDSGDRLFHDLRHTAGAVRLDQAPLPEVGTVFAGFHLQGELGRGTFGRVYLARQGDLAGRLVALKVSTEVVTESQKLARLQHTHIVPVYSLHRAGPLQAVCMPYLGATTLADLLHDLGRRESLPSSGKGLVSTLQDRKSRTRVTLTVAPAPAEVPREAPPAPAPVPGTLRMLASLTYVEAVLWMGARLADGLAHAHERGILHRDLKPANVLLTDDGQPMLLDFNLAEDAARSATAGRVGGTLPYMAPEHLAAFAGQPAVVDARSDLYALGVILFELLTGRHPFGRHPGTAETALPMMLAERSVPPPAVRPWNPAVTRAVEAILHRCLEPNPENRYPDARALAEDLDRQLAHLPLRHAREPLRERAGKFLHRHPRLTSSTSVALACALLVATLLAVVGARGRRLARLEARENLAAFHADLHAARLLLAARVDDRDQLDEGRRRARAALDRFAVLDHPRWRDRPAVRHLAEADRELLPGEVGELLLLLGGDGEMGLDLNDAALACFAPDAVPRALWEQRAGMLDRLGRGEEARALRRRRGRPRGAADCYLLALAEAQRGAQRQAIALLREAVAAEPDHFAAWFLLGNCCLDGFADPLARTGDAVAAFTACVALRPEFHGAVFNRGLAHLRRHAWAEAEADFGRALVLRPALARALVCRAAAREGRGEHRSALADLDLALARGASPVRALLARARVRLALGDVARARRDREQALAQTPADEEGWIARGVARVTADPAGALADFRQAEKLEPRSLAGLQNQAHVLAEHLGKTAEAVAVLDRALRWHPDLAPAWAGRGVLYARLGQRHAALRDAREALARDPDGPATQFQVAGIYALTARQAPGNRDEAIRLLAKALGRGYGLDLLERDPDLVPLRGDPGFRELAGAVRALRRLAR